MQPTLQSHTVLSGSTMIFVSSQSDLLHMHSPLHRTIFIVDQALISEMHRRCPKQQYIAIPSGERAKTRETKAFIEDELLRLTCSQDTLLCAVGGGTTLDVVGFVAATFCRGVPVIFVPTTLLAMVDASIGGKNGINVRGIKNSIGTYYHPQKVVVDISWLETLPDKEIQNGMMEVIKHAFLQSPAAINKVLAQKNRNDFFEMVCDSITYKNTIVEQSLQQPAIRDLLNFGHTIGHALEALENISHGEAIALGMRAESAIAYHRGMLSKESFDIIRAVIQKLLPTSAIKKHSESAWKAVLCHDKKTKKGVPHAVLLQDIGKPFIDHGAFSHPLTDRDIHNAIEEISRS